RGSSALCCSAISPPAPGTSISSVRDRPSPPCATSSSSGGHSPCAARPSVPMNAPLPEPPAVRTTCPYCGVGCGLLARPDGYGGAEIGGGPHAPPELRRPPSR